MIFGHILAPRYATEGIMTDAVGGLPRVGCVARVTNIKHHPDGGYIVQYEGTTRFQASLGGAIGRERAGFVGDVAVDARDASQETRATDGRCRENGHSEHTVAASAAVQVISVEPEREEGYPEAVVEMMADMDSPEEVQALDGIERDLWDKLMEMEAILVSGGDVVEGRRRMRSDGT